MPSFRDRYDKVYEYKDIQFYLSSYTPDPEECRIIILKIIEQASRDYLSLHKGKTAALQYTWQTARDFIFKDKYLINWGGRVTTSAELMELVDIDINWLRRKMRERFTKTQKEDHGEKERIRR